MRYEPIAPTTIPAPTPTISVAKDAHLLDFLRVTNHTTPKIKISKKPHVSIIAPIRDWFETDYCTYRGKKQ